MKCIRKTSVYFSVNLNFFGVTISYRNNLKIPNVFQNYAGNLCQQILQKTNFNYIKTLKMPPDILIISDQIFVQNTDLSWNTIITILFLNILINNCKNVIIISSTVIIYRIHNLVYYYYLACYTHRQIRKIVKRHYK